MEFILPLVLILAGFYVGWNIGANDAANCIGTTVGAQIIPYRKAVAIMALLGQPSALFAQGEADPELERELLRQQNALWGVRDLNDIAAAGHDHGLAFERSIEMPANNHILVLRRP